jgi:hypothetical protein
MPGLAAAAAVPIRARRARKCMIGERERSEAIREEM